VLDSSRLRDHDGIPFCVRCHGKVRLITCKERKVLIMGGSFMDLEGADMRFSEKPVVECIRGQEGPPF